MSAELAAGLVGLLTVGLRWGHARWRQAAAVERELLVGAEVTDVLAGLVERTGGARATVLAAHNGGDIPDIADPMWSSARYEALAPGVEVPSLIEVWQHRPLDAMSRQLLRRILVSRRVVVRRDDLPPGQLRDEYGAHGIQTGLSVALGARPPWWQRLIDGPQKKWLWLCVDWVGELDPTDDQTQAVEAAAARIGNLLRRGRR